MKYDEFRDFKIKRTSSTVLIVAAIIRKYVGVLLSPSALIMPAVKLYKKVTGMPRNIIEI